MVRASAFGFTAGYHWQRNGLDWGVLLWASRGATAVTIASQVLVIAPHQAVWVPAGVAHGVRLSGRGTLRQVHVRPTESESFPSAPTVIPAAPLLRELMRRMGAMDTLRADVPEEQRLFAVLRDEVLREAARAMPSRELPMPSDPRARRAAELLREDVSLERDVRAIARDAGASVRTLERLFRAETRLSLGTWRRRARMLRAMELLADGWSVTAVGIALGYATTSAFVEVFRREVGGTPGRFGRGVGSLD